MSVCGKVVGFKFSYGDPLVVVCSLPMVVAVYAMGGEIDGFLGIVCHSFGLSMTARCRDFLLSLAFCYQAITNEDLHRSSLVILK